MSTTKKNNNNEMLLYLQFGVMDRGIRNDEYEQAIVALARMRPLWAAIVLLMHIERAGLTGCHVDRKESPSFRISVSDDD